MFSISWRKSLLEEFRERRDFSLLEFWGLVKCFYLMAFSSILFSASWTSSFNIWTPFVPTYFSKFDYLLSVSSRERQIADSKRICSLSQDSCIFKLNNWLIESFLQSSCGCIKFIWQMGHDGANPASFLLMWRRPLSYAVSRASAFDNGLETWEGVSLEWISRLLLISAM